jgi:hypothetical protein
MIKIVVAYDDNDSTLADYFEESYSNLLQSIQSAQETPTVVLKGLECTEINVNAAVTALNVNPFLFIGLSHGDETGNYLLTENNNYITPNNSENFINSFFYTTACNAGLGLRENLLQNGCKIFIGYTDNSKAPLNEDYNSLFIDCELYAIKQFMSSNSTIDELFNAMMNYTQTMIDRLFENDETIIEAMDLQRNKDSMILFGDGSLCKHDFEVS